MGNNWTIIAVQMLFNLLVTICLAYVAAKGKKIDGLESKLSEANDRQIHERFAAIRGELKQSIGPLTSELQRINERLAKGDAEFERLVDGDWKNELKLARNTGELQRWMLEKFASKEDQLRMESELKRLLARG